MKKILTLAIACIAIHPCLHAQATKKTPPPVAPVMPPKAATQAYATPGGTTPDPPIAAQLGNIPMPPVTDMAPTQSTVTREDILANPKLVVNNPKFKVVSYLFDIAPKQTFFTGPYEVTGPDLSQAIIKLLKDNKDLEGTIMINNIMAAEGNNPPVYAGTIVLKLVTAANKN